MNEIYELDPYGRKVLCVIDPFYEDSEYTIADGVQVLEKDLFKEHPGIQKLKIPASVCVIPEGTLTNGGGWASDEKGITEITLDPQNTCFVSFQDFFCEIKEDGSHKLLRYLGQNEQIKLPESITEIGEKAFTDHMISNITIALTGQTIWFPKSHAYFLNILLGEFGKNGKLYDFSIYDKFLLENHFNTERIKMACERLNQPYDFSDEEITNLKNHLYAHEENILEALEKNGAPDTLEDLATVGFFREENIDRIIDSINRTEREDLLSWLINYKHEKFGVLEYDFDI